MNWDQIKCNRNEVSLTGLPRERYGYEKVNAESKVDEFARALKRHLTRNLLPDGPTLTKTE